MHCYLFPIVDRVAGLTVLWKADKHQGQRIVGYVDTRTEETYCIDEVDEVFIQRKIIDVEGALNEILQLGGCD